MTTRNRTQRIVLIEPKSSHIHVYSFAPIPRLGAVLLGTILRDRGYHVDVFIEDLGPVDLEVIRQADLVGISLITSTAGPSYRLAEQVRAMGIPVILGGPHVSFLPNEAMERADYVLRGEADQTFPQFVDALFGGGDLSAIPGLIYREDGETVTNEPAPRPSDLDANPFADFSLVRAKRLSRIASISTSRGCPFDCSFCSVTAFNGRGYRMHSVDRVLDEIEFQFSRNNFRHIFFADDIFNANQKRMAALLEGMIQRGLTPGWGAQMRHEVSRDDELLKLMKRANCQRAFIGFESINPKALVAYNKKETVEDVIRTVQALHRHQLKVHGMFVVGCDEDSVETVRATLRFSKEHEIDTVQFMVLTPLPGSHDYQPFAQGKRPLLSKHWDFYDGHHVVHDPQGMSAYELQRESMSAMRGFYSLRHAGRALMQGEWLNALIRVVGWRLVRQWHKDPENLAWVQSLRERMIEGARAMAGGDVPLNKPATVAVASDPAGPRALLEQYLRELGARVEHVREDVGAYVGDRAEHASRKLADALRHAHVVIATPGAQLDALRDKVGEELSQLRSRIDQLPRVLHMPEDTDELRTWLFQLGLVFSDDVKLIREACERTMAEWERRQTERTA